MKVKYFLDHQTKTRCPTCHEPVELLAEHSMRGPAFYVCWSDKTIFQIGVGPVGPSESPKEVVVRSIRA